jgi:hypothetical protein
VGEDGFFRSFFAKPLKVLDYFFFELCYSFVFRLVRSRGCIRSVAMRRRVALSGALLIILPSALFNALSSVAPRNFRRRKYSQDRSIW